MTLTLTHIGTWPTFPGYITNMQNANPHVKAFESYRKLSSDRQTDRQDSRTRPKVHTTLRWWSIKWHNYKNVKKPFKPELQSYMEGHMVLWCVQYSQHTAQHPCRQHSFLRPELQQASLEFAVQAPPSDVEMWRKTSPSDGQDARCLSLALPDTNITAM